MNELQEWLAEENQISYNISKIYRLNRQDSRLPAMRIEREEIQAIIAELTPEVEESLKQKIIDEIIHLGKKYENTGDERICIRIAKLKRDIEDYRNYC